MKAVICTSYGSPSVLKIQEIDKPRPKANEVLIRVHATAVNASDVRIRAMDTGEGARGALLRVIMRVIIGVRRPRKAVLGSALSGVIEELGEGVHQFTVGDEVFALTGLSFGGHAEYCVLPVKRAIAKKPSKASFEEAAALPFGGSAALYFLRKAGVAKARSVLIYGSTGSVGTAAMQVADYYGAAVDAVCGPDGAALSKQLGADAVWDYTQTDLSALGKKYDIVFDAVGKIKKHNVAHLLNDSGVYCTVASNDVASELSSDLELLVKMFDEGKYQAVIDKTYSLADIVAAHEYVDSHRKKGNVVITLGGSQ